MSSSVFDLAVVGGGIVGLATAQSIASRFPNMHILVLEKEHRIAAHQTGHNSGVIHSGIYYKTGSLKAEHCVRGRAQLLAFAATHGITHDICGKLIVATNTREEAALLHLYERGIANGVQGLSLIGKRDIRCIEPHCGGSRAIHVPGAGIISYTRVAEKLAELLTAGRNAHIKTGRRVEAITTRNTITELHTEREVFRSRYIIACAGLHADRIARMNGLAPSLRIVGFRGDYYDIAPHALHKVRNLIYPVPDPQFPFLGVHCTRMIGGGVECGPNAVFSFKREGYGKTDFDLRDTAEAMSYSGLRKLLLRHWRYGLYEYARAFSRRKFLHSLQQLVPAIEARDITPARAGVRAVALAPNGTLIDDFAIEKSESAIHVLSAPSPAATASLAIGDTVCAMAREHFGL